ncbi:hypothetical protein BOH72_17105 [Mycobacterium sp. WY10]|nr:hypothetical protein BOH72_17105 [Mycobacterium sp. WY10]
MNAAAVVLLAAVLPAAVKPPPPRPIDPPPAAAVWLPALMPPSGLLKPTLDVLLKLAFSCALRPEPTLAEPLALPPALVLVLPLSVVRRSASTSLPVAMTPARSLICAPPASWLLPPAAKLLPACAPPPNWPPT